MRMAAAGGTEAGAEAGVEAAVEAAGKRTPTGTTRTAGRTAAARTAGNTTLTLTTSTGTRRTKRRRRGKNTMVTALTTTRRTRTANEASLTTTAGGVATAVVTAIWGVVIYTWRMRRMRITMSGIPRPGGVRRIRIRTPTAAGVVGVTGLVSGEGMIVMMMGGVGEKDGERRRLRITWRTNMGRVTTIDCRFVVVPLCKREREREGEGEREREKLIPVDRYNIRKLD